MRERRNRGRHLQPFSVQLGKSGKGFMSIHEVDGSPGIVPQACASFSILRQYKLGLPALRVFVWVHLMDL